MAAAGWKATRSTCSKHIASRFVRRGMVVANVEYRLAQAAPAPAAVNDVLKAAQWFQDHAAQYRVDRNRILATGGSAGGHLALMIAMMPIAMTPASADLGPAIKIAAVIDFFGVADVADQVAGPNRRRYAEVWIPEQPDRLELARRVSPMTYVRKGLPPILALHGDADATVPYEQSVSLVKALKNKRRSASSISRAVITRTTPFVNLRNTTNARRPSDGHA
jgi:acetyl esterase/lipase